MRRQFVLACAPLAATAAHAQDAPRYDRFFIRGGPALATFDASARVDIGGVPVPGADASVKNNTGFAFEGGYFFRRNWAVSLTIGIPPTARIHGAGTLSSAGLLGTAVYGPAALGIQYYTPAIGRFRPYIGAGYDYTLVYHVRGSALQNLHVTDGNGPEIQAGFEYRVSRHTAFFVDLKKIWVSVDGNGIADTPTGPMPAHARLALDPLIGNTGISYHF